MEALYLKLLYMGFAASRLIWAVLLLRFLLRNAPKAVRCMLWALVAVRLICPVSIPSAFSLAPREVDLETLRAEQEALPRESPIPGNGAIVVMESGALESLIAPETDSARESVSLLAILSAVWLAGLSAMLLYALAGFLRLRRTVSASLPTGGNLWICDDIPAPFILGILRPRVYLPSNLDEAQARYVIAHENAHLRHYDHFWKPLGYVLLSVY